MATFGAASVCFTPGVRLTDSAGSELSVAHQDRAGGSVSWPPGWGWWANVVDCQGRGWWASVWHTRTRLVASVLTANVVDCQGRGWWASVWHTRTRLVASVLTHQALMTFSPLGATGIYICT